MARENDECFVWEKGLSKESPNAKILGKRVSILEVTSFGQPTALIPPEVSPHKR
jgi:hypothetical protein